MTAAATAITVKVLFFAAVREAAGRDEEELSLAAGDPSPVRVRDLAAALEARHGALKGKLDRVRFARNETFVTLDEPLADGDVVAIIPPVAGG